jgi:hypothetical protein
MPGQAAPAWLRGCCQICSQRPPARHALLAAAALTGLSVLEAARDLHALLELARAAR